jgi:hypothetical protein
MGAPFVGHHHVGCEALFLEQLAHQFHCCSSIAPPLRKEIENLAFVVNRAPTPELPARNRHGPSRRDAAATLAGGVVAVTKPYGPFHSSITRPWHTLGFANSDPQESAWPHLCECMGL